jgi:hypothetical protein
MALSVAMGAARAEDGNLRRCRMSAPTSGEERAVARLRYVVDRTTGKRLNTAVERAVCELDPDGFTVRWRVWVHHPDGWRPEEWRRPVEWMLEERREAQRDSEVERIFRKLDFGRAP